MKDLFEDYVLRPLRHAMEVYADRNAFFIAGQYYTYRQLSEAVSGIREKVCHLEDKVCSLEIRDDLETYATILALWMEGKAFVPLNPNQPVERNLLIKDQIKRSKDAGFEKGLAYVLFTSGSTGTPKGVAISFENLGAFMDSFWKTGVCVTEKDRCLQCFDLTFDVSIQSFLVALTRGACVYTIPYGQVKYLQVAALIHQHHITFGAMAPSMLTYLRPYFPELDASSFRICILTAEACPVDLIEDWYKCAPNVEVYDFYGPTEVTIYSTYYKCSRNSFNLSVNGMISIGKPLANVKSIIVNEQKELVRNKEKGELCLAGEQVTQGYWNNEEKNKTSFFEKEENGTVCRYYRTGDLCYWDESGNIMYVGRIDHQTKIQGFRVELGEIEFHARSYYNQQVRAIAMAFPDSQGLSNIALFLEHSSDDNERLLAYLKKKMPKYMIPSKILFVQEFPLNSNDKIDRNKLKELL